MKHRDQSAIWIATVDLMACALWVAMVHVNPAQAKVDGTKPKAEFLITSDWPVSLDSDIDLWLAGPERKPVFYLSRNVGCADLDRDSLGYSTADVVLADGSVVRQQSNRETISIRCIAPGHYDVAVNLYSDREIPRGKKEIPVHVELTGINPNVRLIYSKDVALTHFGETANVFSFDLSADGSVKMTDPPLRPLTQEFAGARP
jgi:hypothetical protein